GIAYKECPFPSAAIQTYGRPESPPRWPVFFQIDQNTDLAALLVRHVLDSAHGSIVLQMMTSVHCTRAVSSRTLLSDRMDIVQLGREKSCRAKTPRKPRAFLCVLASLRDNLFFQHA